MKNAARVELEPAFILHSRPYRETSQLVETFTQSHGRKGLVARGSKRPRGRFRAVLEPFQPLRLSWSGRGELGNLNGVEPGDSRGRLSGQSIMAGFYANELLLKLLHRDDPHPELFAHYGALLDSLAQTGQVEPLLRGFELELLQQLGYAVNLTKDSVTQEALLPEGLYEYVVDQGPVRVEHEEAPGLYLPGATLLAIDARDFQQPETLRYAKRLARYLLDHHLGGKTLQTRRVASAMKP